MFHQLVWTDLFYHNAAIRLYLRLSLIFTPHFLTFLTLDNYKYHARKRNMKFYLLTPKDLIIQLAKLQSDVLYLNTTFRHCKTLQLLLSKSLPSRVKYMCFHFLPLELLVLLTVPIEHTNSKYIIIRLYIDLHTVWNQAST